MSPLRIAVLHGPNLNLLGTREPDRYGTETLEALNQRVRLLAQELGVEVTTSQHNLEGELVDAIQEAGHQGAAAILINPAAYTHTSVAIRDALIAVGLPTVEIHMTNVYGREPFRHHSFIADIAMARVMGFGADGYLLGLRGLADHLRGS